MPLKLHYGRFSVAECKNNPEALFVFGDNFKRYGKGGQAIIRDCPNAVGFATKRAPGHDNADFLDDTCHDLMSDEFRRFHEIVAPQLNQGKTVWWPADGVGTGLAKMPERAPKQYQRMCEYSRSLFEIVGKPTVSAIVCGSRNFNNRKLAFAELDALFDKTMNNDNIILEIIEGDCKGADRIAAEWAGARKSWGVVHTNVPADWTNLGHMAGPVRNAEMATRLQARKDQAGTRARVIGMPGNKGTNNMLKIARKHGFEIERICMGPDYIPPRPEPEHAEPGHAQSQSEPAQAQMDL